MVLCSTQLVSSPAEICSELDQLDLSGKESWKQEGQVLLCDTHEKVLYETRTYSIMLHYDDYSNKERCKGYTQKLLRFPRMSVESKIVEISSLSNKVIPMKNEIVFCKEPLSKVDDNIELDIEPHLLKYSCSRCRKVKQNQHMCLW